MKLIYIHGANASSISFNYIRSQLAYDDYTIDYNSQHGFANNLARIITELNHFNDMFLIGHSLGGIYALHIANILPKQVVGAVTLSTPYGGSEVADFVKYLVPCSRLFRDIGPNSDPIMSAKKLPLIHPWCNVVTTAGNSVWIPLKNDGVVTIASMRARPEMTTVEIETNHYEVVLATGTINIIRDRLS